jgi:hypothetical protein
MSKSDLVDEIERLREQLRLTNIDWQIARNRAECYEAALREVEDEPPGCNCGNIARRALEDDDE